jgi:hypothetical protein
LEFNKPTSLSGILLNKDLTSGTNRQFCGRHHGVYLIGKPMTFQQHPKNAYDDIKKVFLAKEWIFSISQGRN